MCVSWRFNIEIYGQFGWMWVLNDLPCKSNTCDKENMPKGMYDLARLSDIF